MGTDKALLPLGGATLVEHVARQVASVAGSATLVGAPERYAHLDLPALADLYPGEGPLGGVITALRHSTSEWSLVAACDMPAVSGQTFRELLRHARPNTDAIILAGHGGRPNPLCGLYSAAALPVLEQAFAAGVRSMHHALERLRVHIVPSSGAAANVNTPEEWDAVRALPVP